MLLISHNMLFIRQATMNFAHYAIYYAAFML